MILATHGRAIWILDDLAPFQQYATAKAAGNFLFDIEPAVQRSIADDRERGFEGNMIWLGQNPEFGARILYHLGAKADSVSVVITDPAGAPVRALRGFATKDGLASGVNSVVWDLRLQPIPGPAPATPPPPGADPDANSATGPLVLPGEYQVSLVVNGTPTASGKVKVLGEPDITISEADRRTRYDALRELQVVGSRVQHASDAVRKANDQLTQIKAALTDTSAIPAPIKATLDSLTKALEPLKKKFGIGLDFSSPDFDFNEFRKNLGFRVGSVSGGIDGATAPASEDETRQLGEIKKDIPGAIAEVNAFLARLPAFYKQLADAGLYPVAPKQVPPGGGPDTGTTTVSRDWN
jgi:hypothetical protein